MGTDPYQVLGVSPNATEDEIRQAYRRLAKQYHPDLNPGDRTAAQKMNEINAAYDAIKNPTHFRIPSASGARKTAIRKATGSRQTRTAGRPGTPTVPPGKNSRTTTTVPAATAGRTTARAAAGAFSCGCSASIC